MGKYIIDIEEGKECIVFCQTGIVVVGLHLNDEDSLKPLGIKSAIPYIEPSRGEIYKNAYQKGLSDAWDAAKKIVLSREDGGLFGYEERKAVFGCGNYMALKMFLAPEAIEKIRQYEQKQEKIKVGDEVINDEDIKGVTVDMDDYLLHVLDENGVIQAWPREDVVKTGRHFPEIAEVIKTMQEKES